MVIFFSGSSRVCIFCDLSRKKFHNVEVTLISSKNSEHTINEVSALARKKEDLIILNKIQKFTAQDKIYYHKNCFNNFFRKESTKKKVDTESSEWHQSRELHPEA